MNKKHAAALCAAFGCAALAPAAQAADSFYLATGRLDSQYAQVPSYLELIEVWGTGGPSFNRYALAATTEPTEPYNYLTTVPRQSTVAAIGAVQFASARWSYDPLATPTSVSSSGLRANYAMGPLEVTLTTLAGASSLIATDRTRMVVEVLPGHAAQGVAFTTSQLTGEGPIPGSTFSYGAAPSDAGVVDLKHLLGTAYLSRGFDLSGFQSLPVRLQNPTEFRPVAMAVAFDRREPGVTYGLEPPASLLGPDFAPNPHHYPTVISVTFDGLFGVSVDPLDFAAQADYLAARDWVTGNIQQINYEISMTWYVESLSAVPEPGGAALAMAGLTLLLLRLRHRRA